MFYAHKHIDRVARIYVVELADSRGRYHPLPDSRTPFKRDAHRTVERWRERGRIARLRSRPVVDADGEPTHAYA